MWKLNNKKGWALKNWCLWTLVLEKTLESPLPSKEIRSVNSKGNQLWKFIVRIDAKAEAPLLRPPDEKSWLIGKHPDAGKDWGQKRKGWQRMELLYSTTDSMDMNLSKLWEIVKDRGAWQSAVHEVAKSQRQLSGWTTIAIPNFIWWRDSLGKKHQLKNIFRTYSGR